MEVERPLLSSFLSLLLLFSSLFSPISSATIRCNPNDKQALMRIKESLNNPYHLTSWDPTTDCCSWYCVQCHRQTHRIIELSIFKAEFSGQIPNAVGDLPYLESLTFHKIPNLNGHIQPSIAKLKNLKTVDLTWTSLSGPIPDIFSQLKNLQFLDLSFNQLSGSVPASLSELPKLTELYLGRNKLTGSIPDSFGRFSGSEPLHLDLSHNQLSGEIPKSLGNMHFSDIDLSRNKLVGDASMLFKSNRSTFSIKLSRNLLEFDLSGVSFPKDLSVLDLSYNKIRGRIPAAITGLNLQSLNISYNLLCGEIPRGGNLRRFDYSSFFHNRCLCGPPLANCRAGSGAENDRI